jgi:two-component system phosphate regulon sensor histidine kinase PhoR
VGGPETGPADTDTDTDTDAASASPAGDKRHRRAGRPGHLAHTSRAGQDSARAGKEGAIAARLSTRLKVGAALIFLVLPLAVGAWSFAGAEAARTRSHAEAALQAAMRKPSSEYRRALAAAGERAHTLASSSRVQRAFKQLDRRKLRRLSGPNVGLVLGRSVSRSPSNGVPSQKIRIVVGRHRIGTVIVRVPFDERLLTRLERAAPLSHGRELAFAHGQSLLLSSGRRVPIHLQLPLHRPTQVLLDGVRYVAVANVLNREAPATRLVALAPASEVLAGAHATRRRWLLASLGALLAVALAAYSLAPVLGRSRLSKQQRDRAASVLSHLGEGVFLVDSGGVIRLWNAAAESITGLSEEEASGRAVETALPNWPSVAPRVPIFEADGRSRPETIPLQIGGRELWLSIAGVEYSDGTIYAFRDATSEHRLEAIRAEFVATVSHELRTPLAALHGAALTLTQRGHQLPAETKDRLMRMISAQSKRLAGLVEDILLAGQLDAGTLRVEREPFSAVEVARAAVDEARQRAAHKSMLRISTSDDLPRVLGDEGRTHQILANLIDNAVKYSPAGSRVDVEVQRENGRVRFSVRDRGPGIPATEREHVFEKFYRLDPDHRQGVGGSGLGLYICRQLVSSMHGRIWVESAPQQQGSTFAFDLPIANAA